MSKKYVAFDSVIEHAFEFLTPCASPFDPNVKMIEGPMVRMRYFRTSYGKLFATVQIRNNMVGNDHGLEDFGFFKWTIVPPVFPDSINAGTHKFDFAAKNIINGDCCESCMEKLWKELTIEP
jgi:hypothetical protein